MYPVCIRRAYPHYAKVKSFENLPKERLKPCCKKSFGFGEREVSSIGLNMLSGGGKIATRDQYEIFRSEKPSAELLSLCRLPRDMNSSLWRAIEEATDNGELAKLYRELLSQFKFS